MGEQIELLLTVVSIGRSRENSRARRGRKQEANSVGAITRQVASNRSSSKEIVPKRQRYTACACSQALEQSGLQSAISPPHTNTTLRSTPSLSRKESKGRFWVSLHKLATI